MLARMLLVGGATQAALVHAKRALYLDTLISGAMHPATISSHVNLAVVYQHGGRVLLALDHLQEALRRYRVAVGPNHHYTALW